MCEFHDKFPYFLYRILLSESNYAILYGKSAEKGLFFPFLHNKCKLLSSIKKWDKKRRENAKKHCEKMEKSPQKNREKIGPLKSGGGE